MFRLMFLVAVFFLWGCDTQHAQRDFVTYSTPDEKYMAALARVLRSNNVPFRLERNGALTYSGADAPKVDALQAMAMNHLEGIATRYESAEMNVYLRKVLNEHGMEYTVEKRDDGEWTRWFPDSDKQEEEVRELVRQLASRDSAGKCKLKGEPSNNALNDDTAKERLAC